MKIITTSLRLLWRLTTNSKRDSIWRWIWYASTVSVFLATAAAYIAHGIMDGLHQATFDSLTFLYPALQVCTPDQITPIKTWCADHGISASEQTMLEGSIRKPKSSEYAGAIVLALDPAHDYRVTKLAERTAPYQALQKLDFAEAIIAEPLARQLGVTIGNRIIFQTGQSSNETVALTIAGLITVGMQELDEHLLILNLDTIKDLEIDAQHSLAIFAKPQVITALHNQLRIQFPSASITTISDAYPAFMQALALEERGFNLLLGVLLLLIFMHIAAVVALVLAQRLNQMAHLYLIGVPLWVIRVLFTGVGGLYALLVTIPATGFAHLLARFINDYQLIKLPDVYFCDFLPIISNPHQALQSIVLALAVGSCAGFLVSLTINKHKILQVTRV